MLAASDIGQPVALARALVEHGVSLKRAHAVLDRLASGHPAAVELESGDIDAAIGTLTRLGVAVSLLAPPDVDVKAVREQQQISQHEFAIRYGLDIDTLQNWEQGRNTPDKPAMVLLKVIEKHPEAVIDALSVKTVRTKTR